MAYLYLIGCIAQVQARVIHPEWNVIQNQTYSGNMNASQAAQRYLESTANHLASNPHIMDGQGMTMTAAITFLPGLAVGLRH